MAMAKEDVLNKNANVLGISVKQCEVLSNDGYDTMSTIIHCKFDKIREFCTTRSKLKAPRVRTYDGYQKTNCLQALAWWATNLTLRGKHIVLSDFDTTMTSACIYETKLDYADGKKDPDIEKLIISHTASG